MKLLLISPDGKRFLADSKGKLETHDGCINLAKAKPGEIVRTHLGAKYLVLEPEFHDLLSKAERGPQVIHPKDFATIVAHTNLKQGDKVVDAGAGSGWLSAQLAYFGAKVTSYEIRKDFSELAKRNFKFLGVKVKLKNKDITKGIEEKDLDLITLDLLEPAKVPNISESLRIGGYCVCYVPHIEQAVDFAKFAKSKGLYIETILEVSEKEFNTSGQQRQGLPHTGFLVFARKVLK